MDLQELPEHSLAKHEIFRNYLLAWLPILARQGARLGSNREMHVVDGFAGPGAYRGNKDGSPIIAMRLCALREEPLPVLVRLLFVELDKKVHSELERRVGSVKSLFPEGCNVEVEVKQGDCTDELTAAMDRVDARGVEFGPAFVFLDQYGYSQVPMSLVERVLRYPECEVLIYLDYKDINRFIEDPSKETLISRAFGGDEWKQARRMQQTPQRGLLLTLYKDALKKRAGAKHVLAFTMFNHVDRPLYWLVFATRHPRGIEVMKDAMYAVDGTGSFRFSDKDVPGQLELLSVGYNAEWLKAELIKANPSGIVNTVGDVREFVLETNARNFRGALQGLERDEEITVIDAPERRRGDFSDDSYRIRWGQRAPRLF